MYKEHGAIEIFSEVWIGKTTFCNKKEENYLPSLAQTDYIDIMDRSFVMAAVIASST